MVVSTASERFLYTIINVAAVVMVLQYSRRLKRVQPRGWLRRTRAQCEHNIALGKQV